MTKTELIEKIWNDIPVHRRDKLQRVWVKYIIDEVFNNIVECAMKGEPVSIYKFGKFIPCVTPGKHLYNPYLDDYIDTDEKLKIKFIPGSSLLELLQRSMDGWISMDMKKRKNPMRKLS